MCLVKTPGMRGQKEDQLAAKEVLLQQQAAERALHQDVDEEQLKRQRAASARKLDSGLKSDS